MEGTAKEYKEKYGLTPLEQAEIKVQLLNETIERFKSEGLFKRPSERFLASEIKNVNELLKLNRK